MSDKGNFYFTIKTLSRRTITGENSKAFRSLLAEFLLRISFQMGFTVLIIAVFLKTNQVLSLGYINVAMLLPSLLLTASTASMVEKLKPRRLLCVASMFRGLLFFATGFFFHSLFLFGLCATVSSICQQMIMTAKLTYDPSIIPPPKRNQFNSRRSFLRSLAIIIGPGIGGLTVAYFGTFTALILVGALNMAGAFCLAPPDSQKEHVQDLIPQSSGRFDFFRWLLQKKEFLVILVTYTVVISILEMEAPLVFPFVTEAFHQHSESGGLLLGICGIGSLSGSLLMERFGRSLSTQVISACLIFDGFILFLGTCTHSFGVLLFLFSLLGIIAAITMITVETKIQLDAPPKFQASLFSILGFAGGSLGAALTLISTSLADRHGAALVLARCAQIEIGLGLIAAILLLFWRKNG